MTYGGWFRHCPDGSPVAVGAIPGIGAHNVEIIADELALGEDGLRWLEGPEGCSGCGGKRCSNWSARQQ